MGDLQRMGTTGLAAVMGGASAAAGDRAAASSGGSGGRRAEQLVRADELIRLSHGIDDSTVELVRPRQSVSAQVFWGVRFLQDEGELAEKAMRDIAREVAGRLQRFGLEEAFAEGAVAEADLSGNQRGERGEGACASVYESSSSMGNAADGSGKHDGAADGTGQGTSVGEGTGDPRDAVAVSTKGGGDVPASATGAPAASLTDVSGSMAASSQHNFEPTDNTAALLRAAVELRPADDAALTVATLLDPSMHSKGDPQPI